MVEIQHRDSRGFFMLLQKPEDTGYYTHGTPMRGAGQYADPRLLSLLMMIEHRWQGSTIENSASGISASPVAPRTRAIRAIKAAATWTFASCGRTERKVR